MKKIILFAAVLGVVGTSCSKEFTKKHTAKFKLDGKEYTCGEDLVGASYYNGNANLLSVYAYAGNSSTLGLTLLVNLTKINQSVLIDSTSEGWIGAKENSAVQYKPVSGEWKITSHDEGDPSSRHTEGTFTFVGVNQYNSTDTIRITEGSFYVNNY